MMSKLGEDLGNTVDAMGRTQFMQARLMLTMVPFGVLYGVMGAHPLVAVMAGIASALPVFLWWEASRAQRRGEPWPEIKAKENRGMLLAMAFFLALAAGTQTVIYARGWDFETATRFTFNVIGALIFGGVLPFGTVFLGHKLVQQLRGKQPVESRTLLNNCLLAGLFGAVPTGGLLAWLVSLTPLPGSDIIGMVIYIAFAVAIGSWAYRRLRRLYDEQTGQRVA
jgi:hypothetical protein